MTESPIHVLYDILLLVVLIIMNSHRMLRTRRYIFIFGLVGTFIFQIKQLQHQETESNRSAPLSRRVESTASISQKDDPTHDHNKPPVMHTFYEPDPKGYCCGMLEDGHQRLLHAWQKSWQDKGWDTVILTKNDAMLHPLFPSLQEKLESLRINEYNKKCYWRWLAMASVYGDSDDDKGGGWMSDYDTMPLELNSENGIKLASENDGQFTSYSSHVPCLLYGSRDEWDRVILLMIELLPEKCNARASDMLTFLKVRQEVKEEGGILWRHSVVKTFPYKHGEEDDTLVVDCEQCQGKLIAHFSHKGSMDTYRNGVYPKAVSDKLGVINGRGEAANLFMDDYRSQCESNANYDGLKLMDA